MRSYRNPFRARTSEQLRQQGLHRFLRTYGADVLDLLPDEPWDRPVIIRSAPGGGKTSLLRVFSAECLDAIAARSDDYDDLYRRMAELGALDESGPRVLGVRLPLSQGYRDLVDLGANEEVAKKLFFRLLDAHVMQAFCRAVVTHGGRWPEDLGALTLTGVGRDIDLEPLGGEGGAQIWESAINARRELSRLLDSVLPIAWDDVTGHSQLYSLQALSRGVISYAGEVVDVRPLVMFDDGQDLADAQRTALLNALTDRSVEVARWYTERSSALSPEEAVGDGAPGRGHQVVGLEAQARDMGGKMRNGRRVRAFEVMLLDIADRRARKPLEDYADEREFGFGDFLDGDDLSAVDERAATAIPELRKRVLDLTDDGGRYDRWIEDAESLKGFEAAQRWRELQVVVTRHRDKAQLDLLDLPLASAEFKEFTSSSIREAAGLFLHREVRLPFYFGTVKMAKLGSQNVEQFLELSGHLFDEMLALVALGRRPRLDPFAQDRLVHKASQAYWQSVPQRLSYGRDIHRLLFQVGKLANRDTYRAKASYAPGVTGTALSMRDVSRLLDPDVRRRLPGSDELLRALGGAISHNLLAAEPNRSVKYDQWFVLYLNRMLCPYFGLPLGYGGFRERTLEQMCEWMVGSTTEEPTPDVDMPTLFDEG